MVIVKAELLGVDKKDIDVSVTNNTVTIKGKTSHEEKELYKQLREMGANAKKTGGNS